jgi:hypothetical protein
MKYLKIVLLVVFVFFCRLEVLSLGLSGNYSNFLDLGEYELLENYRVANEEPVFVNLASVDEESEGIKQVYGNLGKRKNKEGTLTRAGLITGAVLGVMPGLILYSEYSDEEGNFLLCTVGGGLVGGLSGFAYARVFVLSKPSCPQGFIQGVFLGGLAGAATYAAAGGLLLVGCYEDWGSDIYGVGILVGSIIGAVTGAVFGGVSGVIAADYLKDSEGAFINIRDEGVGLGVPLPTLEVSSFNPDELQCSFELVSVSF